MDLGAYVNIGDEEIEQIVKANNIDVPRLRGYRLMESEEVVDLKEIWDEQNDVDCVECLCESCPFWNTKSYVSEWSWWTDYLKRYFLYRDKDGNRHIRWDRIHGWKRKVLKTFIHNEKNRYLKQNKIWNKYVGRKDILYIHARIGGGNWRSYYQDVVNQPWFIEKVDDAFDSTYCDIYAKIERR